MRILGVDPGESRIGLAISDPTGVVANPLGVVKHMSRQVDAAAIAQIAVEHAVVKIIVGHPLDEDNRATPQFAPRLPPGRFDPPADQPAGRAVGRDRQHPGRS